MKKILLGVIALVAAGCGGSTATDPCLECGPNATCDAAAATCTCAAGYSGDGTKTGTGCTDVDECATNKDNCDTNATCTNSPGSFSCACTAGYMGNGVACNDVDECGAAGACADHATCSNAAGTFSCACDAGFTGAGTAGTTCTDVDECASATLNTCGSFQCGNTEGAFDCNGLYAVEPFDGILARLDAKTHDLLDLVSVTSDAGEVTGITTMVKHPMTGVIYAMAKITGVTGRAFGTLNLDTAVFTMISAIDRFSSLEFLPDGTLYGVTGAGAMVSKTMHTIDLTTGAATVVATFTGGADGEHICYDPDAALMYRFSGNSTSVMESFALATPDARTVVVPDFTDISEVFGCRYVGNHSFLVYDIASQVRMVDATGTVTVVPDAVTMFNDVRATVAAPMAAPHRLTPVSGTIAGGDTVTLRGIGLTGATVVEFGGVAAASFTVVSDTEITAVTPAVAASTVDVVVTTPLRFKAKWPAAFTFAP
jgi:hypothetical protein